MYRTTIVTLPLIALLGACGTSTPANEAAPAVATASRTEPAAIRALPAGQRSAVFLRAIRDSGAECQQVTQASEQPVAGGPSTWAVECDRAGRYVVAIDTAGIATITAAAALPQR